MANAIKTLRVITALHHCEARMLGQISISAIRLIYDT